MFIKQVGKKNAGFNAAPYYKASVAGYVGPGDVAGYSGAWAYWGMRGYNAAYATGSNPAIDVTDAATGTSSARTINITSTGGLDLAAITATGFGSSNIAVIKIYDQTGNGRHMVSITARCRLVFASSTSGISIPVLDFAGSGSQSFATSSAPSALAQPITASVVVAFHTFSAIGGVLSDGTFNSMPLWNNAAGSVRQSAPTDTTYTGVTDGQYASIQSVLNSSNSTMNVANSGTNPTGTSLQTGNPGATGFDGTTRFCLGAMTPGPSVPLDAYLFEALILPTAVSSTNQASQVANQRAYGGF